MSDGERPGRPANQPPEEQPQGPNLKLLYGLIVLALIAATGIALMIVLPFYQRL
jgi:hypothetical protein